ncbi:MAG: PilZ domain-containing protein [Pseudobdellovibrionaceae bacterium]
MKTKPWSLIVLALLHVLAPIGNLFLNAYRAGRTLEQQWYYWFLILPKYIATIYILVPILAGIFIFLCRRWSYWAYLACLAILFISNVYGYWTSMHWNTLIMLLLVLGIDLIVVAYFIVPSVQSVYMDPRMRWWEAAPRYNFRQEGTLNGEKLFIKNISQGGLLATFESNHNIGDKVLCVWNFEGVEHKFSGNIIYQNPQLGYGIKFEHTPETQRHIKGLIDKLHARKAIVIERLPGPEDSFGVWLKKLLMSGEGLFPKVKR